MYLDTSETPNFDLELSPFGENGLFMFGESLAKSFNSFKKRELIKSVTPKYSHPQITTRNGEARGLAKT